MLVYAVIVGHNYEGYSEPAGIFSTYEKASEFYDRMDKKGYDSVEIFEYEMDEPWSGFKA
jgi:hypothetical protein